MSDLMSRERTRAVVGCICHIMTDRWAIQPGADAGGGGPRYQEVAE